MMSHPDPSRFIPGGGTPSYKQIIREIALADRRIHPCIRRTPLEPSPWLSRLGEACVDLKLENTQITGSFKLRGAANRILSLSPKDRHRKLLTASTGNHGTAMAYMLQEQGLKGVIYVPQNTSAAKIDLLGCYAAQVIRYGSDCTDAETLAKKEAESSGDLYISPYNDEQIIAGQGTLGLELLRQKRDIDTMLVPVGGGGLISGIALALKSKHSSIQVIGCQPVRSAVMAHSIEKGHIVREKAKTTLSDGTAGGIEEGAVTFDICRHFVHSFILLEEHEIKNAVKCMIEKHHLLVEGSAALSVAAFIKEKRMFRHRNVVLIISGANIGMNALRRILFFPTARRNSPC